MSVQVSYKKQLILGILFLMGIVGAIEGIARAYEELNLDCDFVDQDLYKDIDYFKLRQLCHDYTNIIVETTPVLQIPPNQHFPTININSHGFRGPEITLEKEESIYRIFFLGGSTAFGVVSTSDETTITGFLQQKLDLLQSDKKIEVINAGIGSSASINEVAYIKNKLVDYDPDLFIIYDGINDAQGIGHNNKGPMDDEGTNQSFFKFRDFPFYRTPFVIFKIIYAQPDVRQIPYPNMTLAKKIADVWENRWIEICNMGQERDFSTVIFVQPMLGTSNRTYSPDEMSLLPKTEDRMGFLVNLNEIGSRLPNLNQACPGAFDLRNVFDGKEGPFYYDEFHTRDNGNEVIADEIRNKIKSIILNEMKE